MVLRSRRKQCGCGGGVTRMATKPEERLRSLDEKRCTVRCNPVYEGLRRTVKGRKNAGGCAVSTESIAEVRGFEQ